MVTEKLSTKDLCASFDYTTSALLQLISSVSAKKLNTVPFAGSWTAAQVGEHLLKSYAIVDVLNGPVKKTERQPGEKIESIREVFLDFTIKMTAPEFIIPTGNLIDKELLLFNLQSRLAQIKEVVQTKDLSEICTSWSLPKLGELTRLEWVHFILYHTQRHNHQLQNIFESLENA